MYFVYFFISSEKQANSDRQQAVVGEAGGQHGRVTSKKQGWLLRFCFFQEVHYCPCEARTLICVLAHVIPGYCSVHGSRGASKGANGSAGGCLGGEYISLHARWFRIS